MTGAAPADTAGVRRLLALVLRSDGNLDAFCLDYFPSIYRSFSRGMSRVEKVNLLLEQERDLPRIVARLRECCPDDAAWRTPELTASAARRARLPLALWALGLALVLGAVCFQLSRHSADDSAQRTPILRAVPESKEPAAVATAVLAPPPPGKSAAEAAGQGPSATPCGNGNNNASCNQIQAAPNSKIIISARQGR